MMRSPKPCRSCAWAPGKMTAKIAGAHHVIDLVRLVASIFIGVLAAPPCVESLEGFDRSPRARPLELRIGSIWCSATNFGLQRLHHGCRKFFLLKLCDQSFAA